MPKTRRDTDRDAKIAEILDAADAQLDEGGYDALSVAAIARGIGIAQNAVYWYFPSKDHLFVAALERRLLAILKRPGHSRGDLLAKITRTVDGLHGFYPLWVSVQQQAPRSKVVAEFAEGVDAVLRAMLSGLLADHLPKDDVAPATDLIVASVEGTFLRGLSRPERNRLLRFTIERLVG